MRGSTIAVLLLLGFAAGEDLCAQLEKIVGGDCTIADPGVCLKITCDINLAKVEAVKVDVDLSGVCNRTAPSVTFAFREKDMALAYRKTVGIGANVEFPVPGLNIGIHGLQAGVYGAATLEPQAAAATAAAAAAAAAGGGDVFEIDLGVDACASVLGKSECGSQITSDLPYWIAKGVINATDTCNGPTPPPTPAPTLPKPNATEVAACLSCVNHESKLIGHDKDWCWVDYACHDTGSVHNPCFPATCVSKAKVSKCSASTDCTGTTRR